MADSVTVTRTTQSPTPAQRREEAEKLRLSRLPRQFWDPQYYADPRNANLARSISLPALDGSAISQSQFNRLQIAAQASMIAPGQAQAMIDVLSASPFVSPGTATALSSFARTAQMSEHVRERILTLDAEWRALESGVTGGRNPDAGSEAEKGSWFTQMLKGVARPGLALLSMPLETVQGMVRQTWGRITGEEDQVERWDRYNQFGTMGLLTGAAEQSLGAQWAAGVIDGPGGVSADLGSGWIPRGDVLARQEQAKRDAAPLIFNEHWTLGRGIASLFFDNGDSLKYNNLSGMIDIVGAIVMDPLVVFGAAGAVAQGVRQGGRLGALIGIGRETAEAGITREAIQLSEATQRALTNAQRLSDATLQAVNTAVRDSNHLYAMSMREAAPTQGRGMLNEADTRMELLTEQLKTAQMDLAAARRQTAGERMRASTADDPEGAALAQSEAAAAVDHLSMQLGDDGLDAMMAKVNADSPELPGTFTDAVFVPGQRESLIPTALPGSDSGADAIVMWRSDRAPRLRSVDDPVDTDVLAPLLRSRGPGGRRGELGAADRNRLEELLTSPQTSTYGDLIQAFIRQGKGQTLYNALKAVDIDGITDVFRLTGGEGGVWWTTVDAAPVRWTEEAGQGAWRVYDGTVGSAQERIKSLRAEIKTQRKLRDDLARRADIESQLTTRLADQFVAASDLRTSVYDSQEAIREAVEFSMGVRRQLGGKPQSSHELLRAWLVGPTREFDQMIQARNGMPTGLEAAENMNRGLLAVSTLGVSEAARGVRRAIEPFATRAREATLDAMVRLNYSPKNLGLLQRLSNGKIDPEILKAVLNAGTEDEVLEILGPAVGIDIVRPIGPGVINALPVRMNRLASGAAGDRIFSRAANWAVDWVERQGSVAPRFGAHINFADPMGSAQVLRNYLTNIPHISPETADEWVGRYMEKTTEVGRARALTAKGGIMDKVADELIDYNATRQRLSPQTRDALADIIRESTRVYEGGRAQVNDWWLGNYANDANMGFRTQNGEIVPYVGPQLEAELARGGVLLPSTDELARSVSRWGSAIEARPALRSMLKGMDVIMDWWRSAVLFRLAYTVRNIGEMQFRMFLTGHSTVFNHPTAALAMASAMNKRTRFSRGLIGRQAKYNKTASGRELGPVGQDDLDATENALGEYIELINRSGSYHDERSVRAVEMRHDVRVVTPGQPGFTKGWAEQLIKLRSDRLARLVAGQNPKGVEKVLALGVPREQAIVDWLMHSPGAAGLRREFAETESTLAQIFTDPIMLKDFLFDSPYSVKARVQEYTAGGQAELVDFIVTGRLSRNGKDKFSMSSYDPDPVRREELMATRASRMAQGLRDFTTDLPEDYQLRMRVVIGEGRAPRNALRRGLDAFFDWNGRKENAWAMGPEFSYAFNDAMVEMMPSLNKADRQKVFDFVKDAEGRFRPHAEVLREARAHMKNTTDGPLLMTDAEKYAAQRATEHVRTLFYDATNRRQLFHSLRLVMPFAQPFVDTLWRWGRLMAARPYMVEKFGRLGEALTQEGSGVIYDDFDWIDPFSNRESRDPTQGFIYTDPQTGESKFTFPLIGSALGAVLSPAAGFNLAESMTLTAPVENLNLAFQGDVDYLPGLGPLVSFPLSQVMPDDWFGAFPEWLRDYAFPYGEPRPEGGIVESTVLPSWLRRLTGVLYNEDFRAYSYKGVMAYMVSTKEYPGLQGSPEMQQQLIDDVQSGARWLTFIRALGAAVLPAAPTQEIYAADKDGRLIGSTYLAAHWHHLLQESGNDYEASTKAFIDSYGQQALAAILPSSEGEFAISGPGWEWMKDHPESEAFSDVIGYFFPGDFSMDAYSFQQGSGDRERLSVEERTDRMVQFLYDAEKTQMEGRAAREGWDVTQMEAAEEDLKMRYGGVIPSFTGTDSRTRLDQLRRALDQFEDLRNTRAGEGAQLLFEAYDEYNEMSEYRFGSGLASIKATALREEFLNELDSIASEYGGWNEKDGSVTTIARLFMNVVTPRGQ